jgi:hypothetical protein
MAAFELKLDLFSYNALELVDIAYARPGTKIKCPRIKQIDDQLVRSIYQVSADKKHPLHEDATLKMAGISDLITIASQNLQLVRRQVDVLIENDVLFSSSELKPKKTQTIMFKGKTPIAGAMLRVIKHYDGLMSDILALNASGSFIGTNESNVLMKKAGTPPRRMNQNIHQVISSWNTYYHDNNPTVK